MLKFSKAFWLPFVILLFSNFSVFAQQERSIVWSANVYPNPTEGIVYIELSGENDELTHVNIVNAEGKSVYLDNVFNDQIHRIDLRTLPKGIYKIQLTSTNVYKKQDLVLY